MAKLHARAFPGASPWSGADIAALCRAPGGFAVFVPGGLALGRVVVDEAELLTIAVDPGKRRRGTGRELLHLFDSQATRRGANRAFLEVAADNTAAQALYRHTGWDEVGRRRGYYARPTGAVDALLMRKPLAGDDPLHLAKS